MLRVGRLESLRVILNTVDSSGFSVRNVDNALVAIDGHALDHLTLVDLGFGGHVHRKSWDPLQGVHIKLVAVDVTRGL